MIVIQRGYEDWKELEKIVSKIKDLNTFVDLCAKNMRYGITNDLREKGMVDLNYGSICATVKQGKESCELSPYGVEVWNEDQSLDFVVVDMNKYEECKVLFLENGQIKVSLKDDYTIDNKVYKDGKLEYEVVYDEKEKERIRLTDKMFLELIK